MSIKRNTTILGGRPVYHAATAGSHAILTVLRPGVVQVTTPGDFHMVIDHVSYYLDVEVEVRDEGLHVTRPHVVYRHGGQDEAVSEARLATVLEHVRVWIGELVELAGPEVGTAADGAEAELRNELAERNAVIERIELRLGSLNQRRRLIDDEVASVTEQLGGLRARTAQLEADLAAARQARLCATEA